MKNVQYYLPVINNLTVYSIRWVPPVLCRCKHRALRNVYVGDEIKYSKNPLKTVIKPKSENARKILLLKLSLPS